MEPVITTPAPLVRVQRTKPCAEASPPFISFTMPAYNEEDNIERTVSECVEVFKAMNMPVDPAKLSDKTEKWSEIVVTNDCSRDKTGEILSRLQERIPGLVVVTHLEKNQGYGRALGDAIKASRGEWVATIDSDGQFDPGNLPDLVSGITENIDCVAGYRMKKQDSFMRVFADRGLNMIVRTLFGIRHRDTNCAFKLIRGDIIRKLNIETNGFQTPTEIVLKLNALGYRLAERGVSHRQREEGKSKLKVVKTSIDFLRFLFYLRNKIILYRKGILANL